jgi:hypothetical protein
MNKLKFISFCLLSNVVILSGCSQSSQEVTDTTAVVAKKEIFTEDQAIQMALKTDNGSSVNFPTTPGMKKVEATIGGKTGTTANLDLTTKAEKGDNDTFVVTFIKDWHVKVGNKEVVSYWEYQVDSKGATLLKSEDNEKLIAIIK